MGLMDRVEQLLLDGDYEEAKKIIFEEGEDCVLNSDGMNIMAKIFDVGLRTAYTKEQISASKDILCHITSKMSPKEALITLLEQIEVVCLDSKLYCVLEPLKISLDKLPSDKWETNLKWVLQVLMKRFRQMVFPNLGENEGGRINSKLLAAAEAADGKFQTEIYEPVLDFVSFYGYCLDYILNHLEQKPDKILELKNLLKPHVFSLLGKPLALCPFEYPVEEKKRIARVTESQKVEITKETVAGTVAMEVAKLLDRLDASVFAYHSWLERKIDVAMDDRVNKKIEDESNQNETDDIDVVALVSYFIVVYGKNLNRNGPSSPTREVYTGLYLASILLENDNVEIQLKTLKFIQLILDQLCPATAYHRLRSDLLETCTHSDFISKLSYAFTYSDHNDIRRLGAFIFKSYMWAFDAAGRYKFIKCILHSSGYSDSLIGFVITQLKEFARQGMEKKSGSVNVNKIGPVECVPSGMDAYFTGKHLHSLIQLCLKLNNGPQTDLVAFDGQVLSALNLVRFLLLRDGKKNDSGIVDCLSEFSLFLKNVRKSLDMTILQTKTRIKELNDPTLMEWEAKQSEESKCEMFLKDTEGVQLSLPNECSVQEQLQSCKNVLTKMDLMECILVHTTECYEAVSTTPTQ